MTVDALLARLDAVRPTPRGWTAKCPSHNDRSPSLSIAKGADGRILLHDFGGCSPIDIVAALNLEMKDLFTDSQTPHGQQPTLKPMLVDHVTLAFRFELAALDRRLRAERVMQAVNTISINELSDNDLDRLVDAVGRAYADIERAKLFGAVADDLRLKEFAQRERTDRHAA
jgi:hypothetical protein